MKIIRKAHLNKRTKQISITVPKKDFKKKYPKLKFSDSCEFEIKPVVRRREKNG